MSLIERISRQPDNRRQVKIWTAALVMLVIAGCGALGVKPSPDAQLSGEWTLNTSLSEDPTAMTRARPAGGRGGGMGMPGGAGRMPGGGGGMRGGRGGMPGGGGGGMRGRPGSAGGGTGGPGMMLPDFLEQPKKLSIQQGPKELKLIADGVSTQHVYGEKVTVSVSSGVAERQAGWDGSDFTIKHTVENGPRATRRYATQDTGKQLLVRTKISGGRGPEREFVTVYDRQKP